ncbi:BnaA09g50970D [Brassica napus]|uniref:BnaA09g50970D protein n=1 Tax=Brassica napus TaxID=3708 RepID=A0A078H520_BRANA|nr:BnaA09g50970D [Brassica napus]
MDLLRQEILKKRQSLSEEAGGKKFYKRSDIEQKKLQKLREEERREHELKAQRRSAAAVSISGGKQSGDSSAPGSSTASETAAIADSKSLTDEKNIETLDLPRHEVIRRLRILKQPMTLFGEDDQARLDRLKYVLKEGLFDVDSDVTDGQTNDFLRDISELKKRQKSGIMMGDRKRKKSSRDEEGDRGEARDDDEISGESSDVDADKDLKRLKSNFEELCDEDKILVFYKKLLIEWKQELDAVENTERRTAKGKKNVATFKQCARKKGLPSDIRQALMVMVNHCIKRDYLAAMDHYIKLAIGNAPWPIGVTMVGIHERSAREKIHTNSVAHIMNDETTRKYLQSVKRLMTFCQRRYPTMPSKAVEFNSLANGSDLQSLLAEERYFGGDRGQVSEERLRLMAPQNDN